MHSIHDHLRHIVGMSTACIGECMVEPSEHAGGMLTRAFGGETLNTAVYLARLGVPVGYVSALGTDPFSDDMVAHWAKEGMRHRPRAARAGPHARPYLIRTVLGGEWSFFY